MSISDNIKTLRKTKKITQKELADLSSISRTYLADVENGRYNPSVDTLKLIAKGLDVPLIALLDENINTETSINLDKDFKELYKKINNLPREEKDFVKKLLKKILD